MNQHLISTTDALATFCASLRGAPYVTIDTEFMRERTYYSKLCLVQLGGADQAVAIDPLADGIDLTPLYDLLADTSIIKVFHAARQDIEIFAQASGRVPTPIFDTQVAAMVCGFGDSISYENLASSLAGAVVDKSSRFTDWSQRPLSDKQITYALGDVTHLRIVYEKLAAKLEATGRAEWVQEEMAVLTDPATYRVEPYEVWKRLKLRADKPRRRAVLREIAAWREMEAQRANLPRARIMKDEQLVDIATHAPTTTEELTKLRGLPSGFAEGRHGTAILEAINRAMALPAKDCPEGEARRIMPNGSGAILELLKVLLRQISDEHGVAAKLVATSDDLERLASEDTPEIKTLQGWRRQIFGETALALKNGDIALIVKKNKVTTINV
ncbi:MAG TPA: ribonuclease D [Rhodospirillaceae bacterium]|nr:ribonuclease D [Rhodospirillaceae bacterium]